MAVSPRPFDVAELTPQVATLVAPAQYNPALFELFLLYDLEFVPPTIGPGRPDSFPTRTAIAEPMNLSFNQQTQALADFNIPFYVERQPAGSNRITTNLKWAKNSDQTERRVEAFLEELLMLIKNKVLTEGGNLTQTTVYWFFPASMTPGRVSQLRADWQQLYDRYIGGAAGSFARSIGVGSAVLLLQAKPNLECIGPARYQHRHWWRHVRRGRL